MYPAFLLYIIAITTANNNDEVMYTYRYLIELYLFLVAVHLYANYSAVKALCLDTLNEDRLALIIKHYMMNEQIPEPKKVNKEESVFLLGNSSKIIIL